MDHALIAGVTDILEATVRMATPLALAALGIVILERAGLFGLAIEGMMLLGAFCSTIGAAYFSSAWGGVLFAVAGSALLGLLFGLLAIQFGANQLLVSMALNIMMLGVTSFLYRTIYGTSTETYRVPSLLPLTIPLLHKIPVFGAALFDQPALTYVAILLSVLIWFVLYKTHWGLALRSTGEYPLAVDEAGISVTKTRYIACIIFGALGGLGGSALVLQQVHTFTDNITAGRGFIALVSVIFARWNPLLALGGAVMFGAADAIQMRMQLWTLPFSSYYILMFPYLLALFAIIGFGRGAIYPASIGKHYKRESE